MSPKTVEWDRRNGFSPVTRKERKASTRRMLHRAALSCFCEKGYAATQIADIAEKANVATGTFYVHYTSKEELLDEALREFNDAFALRLAGLWPQGSPVNLEKLVRSTAGVFLDTWTRHREFVTAYAQRAAAGLSMEKLRDGINPPVARLLTAGLASLAPTSAARREEIELVTHGLLSMWLRIGMQVLFNPTLKRSRAEDVLVALTIGALNGWLSSQAGKGRRK